MRLAWVGGVQTGASRHSNRTKKAALHYLVNQTSNPHGLYFCIWSRLFPFAHYIKSNRKWVLRARRQKSNRCEDWNPSISIYHRWNFRWPSWYCFHSDASFLSALEMRPFPFAITQCASFWPYFTNAGELQPSSYYTSNMSSWSWWLIEMNFLFIDWMIRSLQ